MKYRLISLITVVLMIAIAVAAQDFQPAENRYHQHREAVKYTPCTTHGDEQFCTHLPLFNIVTDAPVPDPYIYDENGVSDLINQLPSDQVQELFCTLPYDRKEDIDSLIRFCTVQRIKFRSIPYIRSYVKRTLELQYRHELPTITFKKTPLDATFNACIKRTFDIFISTIFLIDI